MRSFWIFLTALSDGEKTKTNEELIVHPIPTCAFGSPAAGRVGKW